MAESWEDARAGLSECRLWEFHIINVCSKREEGTHNDSALSLFLSVGMGLDWSAPPGRAEFPPSLLPFTVWGKDDLGMMKKRHAVSLGGKDTRSCVFDIFDRCLPVIRCVCPAESATAQQRYHRAARYQRHPCAALGVLQLREELRFIVLLESGRSLAGTLHVATLHMTSSIRVCIYNFLSFGCNGVDDDPMVGFVRMINSRRSWWGGGGHKKKQEPVFITRNRHTYVSHFGTFHPIDLWLAICGRYYIEQQ